MRKIHISILVILFTLVLTTSAVFADQAYHTERLTFMPVGASTGSGQVVNIHPNGPVVGAIERYMIKKAAPNTDYQVVIKAFDTTNPESSCDTTDADLEIPTVLLSTDSRGNGQSSFRFSADELSGFSGFVLDAKWVLMDGDDVAYETECTIIAID